MNGLSGACIGIAFSIYCMRNLCRRGQNLLKVNEEWYIECLRLYDIRWVGLSLGIVFHICTNAPTKTMY